MAIVRWMIGGLIGGLIGAAIWAAIGYATQYEVGWIAWGIGFLVGMGVRMAAPDTEGVGPGATAVLLSIGSILLGKYAMVHLLVAHHMGGAMPEFKVTDPQTMIAVTAETVDEEFRAANRPLTPAVKPYGSPQGENEEVPFEQRFPKEVWAEANTRWQALPQDQKEQKTREHEKRMTETIGQLAGVMQSSAREAAFWGSFSPFDALWFILASLTAFRLGSGNAHAND